MMVGSFRPRSLARPYIGIKGSHLKRAAAGARGPLQDPRDGLSKEQLASLGFRRYRILLAEFIDATAGIHNFLLAGIERMAIGANFDLQILANGRASLEMVAAGASDFDDFIFWMDAGFHRNLDMSVAAESTSPRGVRRHA